MYKYQVKEMTFVNTFRKIVWKFILFSTLVICLLIISLLPQFLKAKSFSSITNTRYPTDLKYIFIWKPTQKPNRYGGMKVLKYEAGQKIFIKQKCEYINCYITYNKSLLRGTEHFDAVVFEGEDLLNVHRKNINLTRVPSQKYIFRTLESAGKAPICNDDFDDFFNLTWTHRLDSDIVNPYFDIYSANNTKVGPTKEIQWIKKMKHDNKLTKRFKTKDRAVAWILTNCKNKNRHQDFVKELRNELKGYNYSLDTYGPCSNNKCPQGKTLKCYKMIEKRYFFLLILEEMFEEDYVTDEVVKSMNHFTIPVVLGGADYNRFLPPGSYINALTFDMKKLGAIIDYLIKNRNMYEYFFDWKNHYHYTRRSRTNVCDLCAKLNSNSSNNSYKNFRKWWNPDYRDSCQRMSLLSLFEKYV
ncbi:alpha-(1,3)-fucosyltransferase C-like [Bombyx mandarina]|uniref:Fucosyltransferase n=1 Tax=Bombyx mandarina TaxID=7092 RepID=A0A6J2J7Z7_BOMMA|nr:alpha-(1,3)-fucosyltransferase C-like [Bombyx mandarina]